jgi:hypothetical protein
VGKRLARSQVSAVLTLLRGGSFLIEDMSERLVDGKQAEMDCGFGLDWVSW